MCALTIVNLFASVNNYGRVHLPSTLAGESNGNQPENTGGFHSTYKTNPFRYSPSGW